MADRFIDIKLTNPGIMLEVEKRLFGTPIVPESLLLRMGTYIQFKIKARTAEGKDVGGAAFKPYSPSYKLFRQQEGHPTEKVNLFLTGSMMSAMKVTVIGTKVRVYFLRTTGKGYVRKATSERGKRYKPLKSSATNAEKAFFLNEKREFFALSEKEIFSVTSMVSEYFAEEIKKYMGQ